MYEILDRFHAGHSIDAYKVFGAHFSFENGKGVRFTVYAPHARSVQVIGDFNGWDGSNHYMYRINDKGVWQLFVHDLEQWSLYKYRIETPEGYYIDKSDPYGFYHELRPKTSSIVVDLDRYQWFDEDWMKQRTKNFDRPVSIYEVHLGSWRRDDENQWQTLEDWCNELIPYVKDNGFTHIELLPLTEHPFDGSWGYQSTGYFAPTSRYGTPYELMKLVDTFHQHGIGVILDMVPSHFVKDAHGLADFDGRPLYEYTRVEDAHNEWGTLNFDLWKEEVRSFLMSSFAYWIEMYHADGLRFDAVSNMIYWGGQKNRGENAGALAFMRRSNYYLATEFPNVMLIAEDSSDFQGVTHPTFEMGLGFDYKWDLGWMNDTLKYYGLDPIFRKYSHHNITFSMFYFASEKYLLPLSHDEVVHMKGSLLNKLWGNYEQRFSQIRNLMGYMFAHPGKKLNFMGNEIAVFDEWNEDSKIMFDHLQYPMHASYLRYFRDLNLIYKYYSCLSRYDYQEQGFYWIDPDNSNQSIYSFVREDEENVIVTILNMTPTSYENYTIGVPYQGEYIELINSEKDIYSGCNMCNFEPVQSHGGYCHNQPYHMNIRIAPFACIYFLFEKSNDDE